MTTREVPLRIMQFCDRVMEVAGAEFDDLNPPEMCFAFEQLIYSFQEEYAKRVNAIGRRPR